MRAYKILNEQEKTNILIKNIDQSIELLKQSAVGWKYEGHETTIDTNDLAYIMNLLIHLKEKIG